MRRWSSAPFRAGWFIGGRGPRVPFACGELHPWLQTCAPVGANSYRGVGFGDVKSPGRCTEVHPTRRPPRGRPLHIDPHQYTAIPTAERSSTVPLGVMESHRRRCSRTVAHRQVSRQVHRGASYTYGRHTLAPTAERSSTVPPSVMNSYQGRCSRTVAHRQVSRQVHRGASYAYGRHTLAPTAERSSTVKL